MAGQGSGGNVIAAIGNFFIPGLGHLVQGRILGALFFFIVVGACYALAATVVLWILFAPLGLIFHIWSIISAARYRGSEVRL
ncbi:hypothetical protein CA267_012030 [Alteromonas pelagimontana]|uniref:Uncharacterized protein n=1 Tax=Alteromonas pelagimontana TaxID=1858656 RepID=A0A6M4MFR2_9ALTE|nr:hypothetical protein [Alteromonas pelagimontana]QJR81455.1 hypothetical protein CA267_012030 [Alteromonas pelagimontana]